MCIGFTVSSALAQTPIRTDRQSARESGGPAQKAYVRPDFHQRLHSYLLATFGPVQMGRVVFGAAISHADNVPRDWGQGWAPYGERVASHMGMSMIDGGTNLLLSEALREDTRYYPCSCKGIWPRAKHALLSSVTARAGEDGHRVFSLPTVASSYAGAFAGLGWYPPRFGPKDAFRTGNYDLLGGIGTKVALEFLSPVLRKFHF